MYPNEIEAVVSAMPGIREVAALAHPDAKSGEVVRLCVVADPQVTRGEIEVYCRKNLAGYKRPKVIEFYESLPKSPVGKVLRRALRTESETT